jgi:hypothetical protein
MWATTFNPMSIEGNICRLHKERLVITRPGYSALPGATLPESKICSIYMQIDELLLEILWEIYGSVA